MISKFTRRERLEIGRKIFEGEINQAETAVLYNISQYTARDYLRLYKATLAVQDLKENTAVPAGTVAQR